MKLPSVTLVSTRIAPHVSFDEIKEFESACISSGQFKVARGLPHVVLIRYVARCLYILSTALQALVSRLPAQPKDLYVLSIGYVSSHYAVYKSFPYFTLSRGKRCLWMYDAWPSKWGAIARFIRRYGVALLMCSSRQATHHLQSLAISGCRVEWVPEAVTVANYRTKPHADRRIDILQLGRKWNWYHEIIKPFCDQMRITYKYEKMEGELIFKTRSDFICGLSDSKISICVPASLTHPIRSGGLETMTWRYLQSIASKCLLLGHAPKEMLELFGYNPVVEIDTSDPTGQINDILQHYDRYMPLIDKNYSHVCQRHQWSNRVCDVVRFLREQTTT